MLRTLAINSNKKCVKFWCFDSFLINKAIWDWGEFFGIDARSIPGQGIRIHHRRVSGQHIRVGIVLDCRHLHPDARRHLYPTATIYTRMRADIWHPAAAICTRLLRTFHPDVHIRNSGAGWERRRFQLLRMEVSGSSDSVYLDGRAAILHSAAVFSWSFLIFATNILGYFEIFCFRYLLSKSPKSPCNPPIIGFLSL